MCNNILKKEESLDRIPGNCNNSKVWKSASSQSALKSIHIRVYVLLLPECEEDEDSGGKHVHARFTYDKDTQ